MTALNLRSRGAFVIASPDDPPDAERITVARLGLSGGTLSIDVGEADPVPSVEVFDADAASWWLFALYGPVAATRIIDFADAADAADAEASRDQVVDAASGPSTDSLRRLALALWLRRWAPGLAVEWLLDVEAGVVALDAEDALDRDVDLVERLVAPHLEHLATNLADHFARAAASRVDAAVDTVLQMAGRVALEVTDPGTDGYDDLDAVVRSLRDARGAKAPSHAVDTFAPHSFDADDYALAAGSAGERTVTGVAPVDPRAVPPRLLSSAADAVTWTVQASARGVQCAITVALAPGASTDRLGQFFARIDYGGQTTVVALRHAMERLRANAWLDEDAERDDLSVTVHSGIDRWGAVRPISARTVDQEAIAAIGAERAALAVAPPQGAWNDPFAAELEPQGRVRIR